MKLLWSVVVSSLLLLSPVVASPVAKHDDKPPTHEGNNDHDKGDDHHGKGPKQVNQCSTGTPYCCSPEESKNTCIKSTTNCKQTVICCNNDSGYQLCIGDINFNIPINVDVDVNVDLDKYFDYTNGTDAG